jgi:hypothetical protein
MVHGRGFDYLRAHGIGVDVGIGADSAVALNQPFFTLVRERRPFVVLKAATSRDGRIAEAPGRPTALTSAAANRHAHRVRAEIEAIGVGIGTILADDPSLTARGAFRERPLTRVVFDRRLRTPPGARGFRREAGPVIIMTTAEAARRDDLRRAADRGAENRDTGDGSVRAAPRASGRTTRLCCWRRRSAARGGVTKAWSISAAAVTPHVLGPGGRSVSRRRRFLVNHGWACRATWSDV